MMDSHFKAFVALIKIPPTRNATRKMRSVARMGAMLRIRLAFLVERTIKMRNGIKK